MQYIKVDEALWASSMLPEGILERWFIASGDTIKAGERIAEVRVEDALHEIVAPADGCATIVATANTVIEPGSILATLGVPARVRHSTPHGDVCAHPSTTISRIALPSRQAQPRCRVRSLDHGCCKLLM